MAPPTRSSVTTQGVLTLLAMTSLEMGDMRPHMVLAPSMEACPFQLCFSMVVCGANPG